MHGFNRTVWQTFSVIKAQTQLPASDVQRRFWNQCQHQSWYFLPWHRGYVAAFETIVHDAVVAGGGPSDWALPYWNYSDAKPNARTLPDAFSAATLPDGTNNPLHVQQRFGSGTTPIQLLTHSVSLAALQDDAFTGGDSDIPPGSGGPQAVFHHGPESQHTNGGLESLPHNDVHSDIGGAIPGKDPNDWHNLGLMSMPITAALDPIFWLHHANIDRLWGMWLRDKNEPHQNPADSAWLNGPANRQFVMPKGTKGEWVFTARDVLDTTVPPLEYTYEDETPPAIEKRRVRRLRTLGARVVPAAREREEAVVGSKKAAELIGASDGPVRVAGATTAAVRLDTPSIQSLRGNLMRATSADAAAGGGEPPRVFLKLEGIRGTSDAAIYHVYVDLPPNADPAQYADRLAGTMSLFGVSAASNPDGPNAGNGINQVLEITEIVDALHLSGQALDHLEVRFVPATPAAASANVSIGRVSVFKLDE